jgi:hypothetical protein
MKSDADLYDVLNTRGDWTVYRCPEGCVHLQIGKINLRFSQEEFVRLARFMADANKRLDVKKTRRKMDTDFLH